MADSNGTQQSLAAIVRERARALGFDAVGFAPAELGPETADRLEAFLAEGRHGDMEWMAETAARRIRPKALMPGARTLIALGMSYAPEKDPLAVLAEPQRGAISVYAQGRDYHDVLKGRLKELAQLVAARSGADVKVFVDTAPLMEKPLAALAGLGWQGKHTNLVSREHGSWLFLGAILTEARIAPSTPAVDRCGSCSACLDICPTKAFPAPYQLDARRCIAYLTIEHKGHIAEEFREPIGNRVFGCDDCLAVCPWNKFAQASRESRFHARDVAASPPLAELLQLDDSAFRARFAGTPVRRAGRDRFLRNVLIAAGNSGDKSLLPLIEHLLEDRSPLVRAMAVWATERLSTTANFVRLMGLHIHREQDRFVAGEWARAARKREVQ